jgi:hypothetical protein
MERPGAPRPTVSLPKRGPKQTGSHSESAQRQRDADPEEDEKGAEAVAGWYQSLALPKPFTGHRRLSEGVWRPDLRLVQLTTNKFASLFIILLFIHFIYLFYSFYLFICHLFF